LRGFARVESGEGEAGIAEMQQAMVELAGIGSGIGAPQILCHLAESLRKVGRHDEALGALGLGVAQAEQQGQHYCDAELHRLRAEILLDTDATEQRRVGIAHHSSLVAAGQTVGSAHPTEEAEALFRKALEIARRQEAKTFELRAATSLARLWHRQGKRGTSSEALAKADAARDLLAPVYEWFTEGFDTRDLQEAKRLLDDLR
jgi:predicted ATPase